ncbi:chromosome (plasmid) partitioning protein para / sporulation initiation inhibitor protein soj [hydrocarbon metagenome]|uniref:Chromosome (Plasmid) partitioning protein para / sporulation initiation inhibitor protein soj n=1 Tax=hydrocarbon metagenome TaxID=938273 RepID=A0A0W8E482_9ZZZZ
MPEVISIINLKGGVGKTTITIALGEIMASRHGLKVLIIDLDPQTNATVALIGEDVWVKRNIRGQTLMQLFRDKLENTNIFSAEEAIIKNVSNVGGGINGLDLLPSSLDLIDLQDLIINIPVSRFLPLKPVTVLAEAVADHLPGYDVILIDCPPNLGLITQNGLIISQHYLIPVIPDVLSTYGIPQIVSRIKRLSDSTGITISPLGVVANKFRKQNIYHSNQINLLKLRETEGGYRRLFNTVIPETSRAAAAMDFTAVCMSLHHKYGYEIPYAVYTALTEEVLNYVQA